MTLRLDAILIGVGATLCVDVWALFLRRVFRIRSLDYCLLGRWVLYMPEGTIAHVTIATAAPRPHECAAGWLAHYSIGIGLALAFVWLAPTGWAEHPTLFPALIFGLATVVLPFLTLQPAFGLGVAASKAPHPGAARLKSVMTHGVFGVGIYLAALVTSRLQ